MSRATKNRMAFLYIEDYIKNHKLILSPTLRYLVADLSKSLNIKYSEASKLVKKYVRKKMDEVFASIDEPPHSYQNK